MFQTARAAFAVALIVMAPAAGAQTAAATAIGYRSAFEDYRRFTQEQVGSWKAANENVGRIGGWREYAKESRLPAAAPPKPQAGHGQH